LTINKKYVIIFIEKKRKGANKMIHLSVMSASAKRAEYEAQQLAKEIAHQQYLADRPKRIKKFVEGYFNYAKQCVEKSEYTHAEALVHEDDLQKWGPLEEDEMAEAIQMVKTMFEMAGYKVNNWYQYSDGWRYQSGKIGYLYIRW
jgi:hypothetical protein